MVEYTKKIIYELMQFRRANKEYVKHFSNLKHNSDLCPIVQSQLEIVFNSFSKYRTITYDIQGFKDNGSDVIIRQGGQDENVSYICIQIKSHDDMKSKDYLDKLKSQLVDTLGDYNDKLVDYYIFLCCDINDKVLKNKVRAVESAFKSHKNVHVIEPQYAMTFIKIGAIQIDAVIKSKIDSEDVIFQSALNIVNNYTPSQMGLLFYSVWLFIYKNSSKFKIEECMEYYFIQNLYDVVPDYDDMYFFDYDDDYSIDSGEINQNYELKNRNIQERIANDLDVLVDTIFCYDSFNEYKILIDEVYPIISLMIDGSIRYLYYDDELLYYMMDLFGPMKGYDLNKAF